MNAIVKESRCMLLSTVLPHCAAGCSVRTHRSGQQYHKPFGVPTGGFSSLLERSSNQLCGHQRSDSSDRGVSMQEGLVDA